MKKRVKDNPNKGLSFLYNTTIGRIILYPLVNSSFISKIVGIFMNSRLSKILIKKFIKKHNINMDDYEKEKYNNFNDFFIRRIKNEKRLVDKNINNLIAPCDSKVTHYKITNDLTFNIKNSKYSLSSIINDKSLEKEYLNGDILVFRLSPEDYHHYFFFDSGVLVKSYEIKGKYHTVNPIVYDKYEVFKENSRVVNVLKTDNFNKCLYIEVGALLVGKIVNIKKTGKFKREEEKGYFKFGGSTVVLVFKKEILNIDKDILANSKRGYETYVKYGEKIGEKRK